ncbi:J domain-containing protein [Sphingosinicella rhizophila]|uniref:DnaJ domain-containing protein n=1 Tax=Sphingosinicella rhizophila TaxID=3050082 RepID=A0ABU3Q7G6_9SPHN|nr:DnaJ domain-containing protein [Sphingosinicella sp. GR2756]MDT9599339.1 DnaJ domain-containing protein [Sphingosinicella sp. GR2756]
MTVWAWWTGRLKGFTYEDGVAVGIFLLGLRLMTTGKILPGALLMAGAIFWAAYRRKRTAVPTMPVDDARRLLGVGPNASLAEIRDAHRRLITKVHPDAGGSAELANRVNAARDTLVAEMNRRTPRAS